MEREANYGLIGGLTLVLLGAAFAFVLWLGQSQFTSDFDEYRVVFDGPVRGLNQGSEVQFNGIPVGEVTSIQLDPDNPNLVVTEIRVREDTPVRSGNDRVRGNYRWQAYSDRRRNANKAFPNGELER